MSNFWKSARRWLPGVIISLGAITAILYFVDLQRFVEAIHSAKYWLLLLVLASSVIWLLVRGMVWLTLLRGKATYRDTFLTVCEGYLLNNFLPFRLGEIGRAFLLSRKSKLGFMEVLPTIVIERILDLAFAATILLGAVPFVVGASGAGRIAMIIGGVVGVGLVALYLLACNRDWTLGIFHRLSAHWPRLQNRGGDFLASLFSGLSILTDGWLFVRVLLWMLLNWAISFVSFYFLLLAFFPQANWVWSLFGLGAMSIGNAIPSLPGAVGTFEAALVGAIILLSGDQSTALAAALVAHLSNYLFTGIIGLYALSNEGETLMGIYRQLQKRQLSLRGNPAGANEALPGLGGETTNTSDLPPDASLPRSDRDNKE
jgi:glycosyltransferase 2 family protein